MIRVYCNGRPRPVSVFLRDGWAVCSCGKRIRVIT